MTNDIIGKPYRIVAFGERSLTSRGVLVYFVLKLLEARRHRKRSEILIRRMRFSLCPANPPVLQASAWDTRGKMQRGGASLSPARRNKISQEKKKTSVYRPFERVTKKLGVL